MKDKICATLTKDHIYICNGGVIGRSGENECTQLEITLDECLCDKWVYIDFIKPDGTTYKTPKLDIVNNKVIYDIPNALLDQKGTLKVQVVLQNDEGEIWKSNIKTYGVNPSINATDDIPNQDDFITEAQRLLNEVEEGLTPTIGDNGNWFILDKDTGKPSRGPKGDDYVITEEDYNEIETNVKSDIQPILEEIENVSKQAEIIAKGRATGYVFDTVEELDSWLLNEENVSKLVLGDNLYIRTVGVPDYWWDGTSKQVLETEKPELTDYAKKEQFVTLLNEKEYEDLSTNGTVTREDGTTLVFSANTYYFIPEQEE